MMISILGYLEVTCNDSDLPGSMTPWGSVNRSDSWDRASPDWLSVPSPSARGEPRRPGGMGP